MGYIGSVILMVICFVFILLNDKLLWELGTLPVRCSFLAVGIWWFGFAQITFRILHENKKLHHGISQSLLMGGYTELKKVWQSLNSLPQLKIFLSAFFFYNMGVQTVMYMAVYFASDELKMQTTSLLTVVLIIQLVAIAGAKLFAKFSALNGNRNALLVLILVWIGICVFAYFVSSEFQFYIIAFLVGLVMGGIQSLSRSTYSKLLPFTNDTASYFSFYDVCEKDRDCFRHLVIWLNCRFIRWDAQFGFGTLYLLFYWISFITEITSK